MRFVMKMDTYVCGLTWLGFSFALDLKYNTRGFQSSIRTVRALNYSSLRLMPSSAVQGNDEK